MSHLCFLFIGIFCWGVYCPAEESPFPPVIPMTSYTIMTVTPHTNSGFPVENYPGGRVMLFAQGARADTFIVDESGSSAGKFTLYWTVSDSAAISALRLYYGMIPFYGGSVINADPHWLTAAEYLASGGYYTEVEGTDRSLVVKGLVRGGTYYFRMSAVDTLGFEGPLSLDEEDEPYQIEKSILPHLNIIVRPWGGPIQIYRP